jgi:hypothetical protein
MPVAAPCVSTPEADEDTDESADGPVHDVARVPDLPARSLHSGRTRDQPGGVHPLFSRCGCLARCCCRRCRTRVLCARRWRRLMPTIGAARWTAKWKDDMVGKPYRELVGALSWLALGSCPDIAFATGTLDRRSIGAYIIKAGGGAVSWKSKKHACVTLSSTEAEYVALC